MALRPRYGHDKPIAARGDGLNTAPFRATLVQDAAEGGDLDRQIGILDRRLSPDGSHDFFFRDEIARALDKHGENIKSARADPHRHKYAAFVAPEETLAPVEAEVLEQENLGRGEHAHASRLPASARPVAPRCDLPSGSERNLAAICENLQLFCKFFRAAL
jgi:hypothetical protein